MSEPVDTFYEAFRNEMESTYGVEWEQIEDRDAYYKDDE